MRVGPYARVLLVLVVLLIGISLFTTERAFYYRDLYEGNPRIKIEKHDNIVYSKFDPYRSEAYTCTTQKVVDSVGMVCNSPDNNISINCTVGDGDTDPTHYFCQTGSMATKKPKPKEISKAEFLGVLRKVVRKKK